MNRTELGFDASGSQSGVPAGLAFDPSTGLFGLVTTDAGLFYVQDDFKTVVSHGLVDAINGNDITTTVDATFLGPDTLVAMASNKTIYGAQRLDGQSPNEVDVWKEYRETSGDLYLLSKMFNSVLTIDPVTFEVTAVHGLPEVGDPSDLVVNDQGVFILARDGGTDVVYQLDGLN